MIRALSVLLAASLAAPSPAAAALVRATFGELPPVMPNAALAPAALLAPSMVVMSPASIFSAPLVAAPALTLTAAPSASVPGPAAAVAAAPAAPLASIAAAPVASAPLPAALAGSAAAVAATAPATRAPVDASVGSWRGVFDGQSARPAAADGPSATASVTAAPSRLRAPSPAPSRPDVVVPEAVGRAPSRASRARAVAGAAGAALLVALPFAALIPSVVALAGGAPAWLGVVAFTAASLSAGALIRRFGPDAPAPLARAVEASSAVGAVVVGALFAGSVAALALASPFVAAVAASVSAAAALRAAGAFEALAAFARPRSGGALFELSGSERERTMSIAPDRFGRLMLLSAGLERGLGEKDLHAARTDGLERLVYFKRVGDLVELVARATSVRATPGSPLERAVLEARSDVTIATAKVVSEDPLTGAASVRVSDLFVGDLFHLKPELESAYDGHYTLDAALSRVADARAFSRNLEVSVRQSYTRVERTGDGAASRLADDARLPLSLRVSLTELPEPGYRPRVEDTRVGFFSTTHEDWSDDRRGRLDKSLIHRWRLEKTDPAAAASPVKKPVVFWIDPSVPAHYRAAVTRGVLAWNKAFEAVGLLGAIEVRAAPEDGSFDPHDASRSVIRWFLDKDANYAIGQTRVDPLTGEIFQATLGISALHPRAALGLEFRDLGLADTEPDTRPCRGASCRHGEHAARQAQMTTAVVEARGGMTEAERERFVQDYITDLTMHEVGHTLGLRHNFLAKTWRDESELAKPGPLAASVMDYLPANVARPGAAQGSFWNTDLGPYDLWAIQYAYAPLDGTGPAEEAAALARIAERSDEPGHAYATDEDVVGLDPHMRPWHLGKDPVAFAQGRMETARELWAALAARQPGTGEDHSGIYRAWVQGWRAYLEAARLATTVVAGLSYRRRLGPGPAPFTPVAGAERLRALALLDESVFADAPFAVPPEFRRRLDSGRAGSVDDPWPGLAYLPYDDLIQTLRSDALSRLLAPDALDLVAEGKRMALKGEKALTPRELLDKLAGSVWGEVFVPSRRKSRAISSSRRRLQEQHLNLLIALAYTKAAEEHPELSALVRAHLQRLKGRISAKARLAGWDLEAREHLRQSLLKLENAHAHYEP